MAHGRCEGGQTIRFESRSRHESSPLRALRVSACDAWVTNWIVPAEGTLSSGLDHFRGRKTPGQPRRGCLPQPRVARARGLPWVSWEKTEPTPSALCPWLDRDHRARRNPGAEISEGRMI